MSTNKSIKEVKALAEYLNMKTQKSSQDKKSGVIQLKYNNQTVTGLASIAAYLSENCQESPLDKSNSALSRAQIQQWLEYKVSVLDRCLHEKDVTTALKELDAYLQHRVYFVNNSLSVADLLIYFGLHSTFEQLTLQEKEGFLHLSRWFNNVQQEVNLVTFYPTLPFSLNYLYYGVTAGH